MTANQHKQTRSQQREEARAKAKALREQHKKDERRKRIIIQSSVAVASLAVIGGIVAALVSGANQEVVEPKNFSFSDGIKIGAGLQPFTETNTPAPTATPDGGFGTVPNIQIFVDYQCPICQAFEVPNQSQIRSWVESGAATVEIHPISFLDGRGSPNQYSSRAANAAICVAEYSPNNFFDFNSALFENQPEEGTPGPENSGLIETAKSVGVSNADEIADCINEKRFGGWVTDATNRALSTPVEGTDIIIEGTPAIIVNGQQYTWTTGDELVSPARFAQWLQQVAAQ